MFRTLIALGALVLVATAASAQPGNLPLSPGVVPAAPFGPGMPMIGRSMAPAQQPAMVYGALIPNRFFGSPYYTPFGGYPVYPYVPVATPIVINVTDVTTWVGDVSPFAPPAAVQPRRTQVAPSNEFPATLVLQLPAAAEVWRDGKKVEGKAAEEWTLTSSVLKAGEQHTFDVKARWSSGGKTYEAKRSVPVTSGNRSRLLVVSGDEVR